MESKGCPSASGCTITKLGWSAKSKGIVVGPTSDDSLIAIDLRYFAKTNETKVNQSGQSCSVLYSTVICNSRSYTQVSTTGLKLVVLELYKVVGDSRKVIRQGEGFMVTNSPGIIKGTVVAACRAIFNSLPAEVEFLEIEAEIEN